MAKILLPYEAAKNRIASSPFITRPFAFFSICRRHNQNVLRNVTSRNSRGHADFCITEGTCARGEKGTKVGGVES
jgi:hypothetical protein